MFSVVFGQLLGRGAQVVGVDATSCVEPNYRFWSVSG